MGITVEPTSAPGPTSAPSRPVAARPGSERLGRVGLAMVALTSIRLLPWAWGVGWSLVQWARGRLVWAALTSDLASMPEGLQALVLLAPLAIGLALWRLRWPQLARAGSVLFFALAIERFAALAMSLALGAGIGPALRWAYEFGRGPRRVVAGMLVVPMVLEFLVAWRAATIGRAWATTGKRPVAGSPERRRGMIGRMVAAVALGLGSLLVGLAFWEGYINLLIAYPSIRRMILQADRSQLGRQRPVSPETAAAQEAYALLRQAKDDQDDGRNRDARTGYFRGIHRLERLTADLPRRRDYRDDLALARNNLAWLLATCPEEDLRDPTRAVELAGEAVRAAPGDGNAWNTLGVAYYRADRLDKATQALEESMRLRDGGDSFDWFFLAMIRSRAGEEVAAKDWFGRAVDWMEDHRPRNRELRRFCAEAAGRLGLPVPEPRARARGRDGILAPGDDLPIIGPGMGRRRRF